MKRATKLLALLCVLTLLATGIPLVLTAAESTEKLTLINSYDFEDPSDATFSQEYEPGSGTGILTEYAGMTFTFGNEQYPKDEVQYSLEQDETGNRYLALDKGLHDPAMTPAFTGFSSYDRISLSMDLAQHPDYEDNVAEYQVRVRTKSELANSQTDTTFLSINNDGAIVVGGVNTGVYLKKGTFTSVAVSVDFTTGRYATVNAVIDGVLYEGGKLDVQSTGMYQTDNTIATWADLRAKATAADENGKQTGIFSFMTWTDHNGGEHAGILFDNICTYSGLVDQARTVVYHLNNGTMTGSRVRYYALDEFPRLPTPVRGSGADAPEFLGWFASEDLSGDPVMSFVPEDPLQIHLYAGWDLTEGLVLFDLDGGTADMSGIPSSFTIGESVTVRLPEVTKENALFAGWYLTPDFTGAALGDFYTIAADRTRDITFYAKLSPRIGIDFDDLTAGQVTSIPGVSLSGDKAGVEYWALDDGADGKYVRWVQGTSDSSFNISVKSADYVKRVNEDTVTFSIDLRADADYATTVAGTLRFRRNKPANGADSWSDVANLMIISKDGYVYAGSSNTAAGGVRLAKLDTDLFHTFSFVVNFTDRTIDAYVDGILAATDVPLPMPSVEIMGEGVSGAEWFRDVQYFNWQSSTNSAGDSSLLIDNISVCAGDAMASQALNPEDAVQLLPGASVRLNDPAGLRFESRLDRAVYEALTEAGYTVTFGTCIFPADLYTGTLPGTVLRSTFDSVDGLSLQEGQYTYYTSIVNLYGQNYARAFGAVSYITVSRGSWEKTCLTQYTEADHARSVYEVSCKAAETGELAGLTEEQQAVVEGYLGAVIELRDGAAVAIEGYDSPYTVTVESGKLTVTGPVDAITAVIVDGAVYTGGWTTDENTLTAVLPAPAGD